MKKIDKMMSRLKKNNRARQNMTDRMSRWGYELIEPSYFEPYDDYIQCEGRASKRSTIKVINNRGGVEILRPDVTLNIIKQLSGMIQDEEVKLCYDTTVFDSETTIRQRRQIGAEYLGASSLGADIEIMRLALSLVKDMPNIFVVGHTKYVSGLLGAVDCTEGRRKSIELMIYNKQINALKDMLETCRVPEDIQVKFMMLIDVKHYDLSDYKKGYMNSDMSMAIEDLTHLQEIMDETITFDLGLISSFDYYDGIIFKAYGKGVNEPILKGGRYDSLSKLYGKTFPAVGFSLELELWMRSVNYVENCAG